MSGLDEADCLIDVLTRQLANLENGDLFAQELESLLRTILNALWDEIGHERTSLLDRSALLVKFEAL